MIAVTRLLCDVPGLADDLRYGEVKIETPIRRSGQERRPVVVWNLIRRCNLHCVHCYSNSQDHDYSGELTPAEAEAFIDDLARYQVPVLLFSGGEPLLRPDLLHLIRRAASHGIRAVVSTNGTLITTALARDLKDAGISYVGVSLDGLEPVNDRFRGKAGAFREALSGIRNCRDAGVRVGLRFTITRHNYRQVGPIFDLLVEEDIPRCCFYHLVYSGRGSKLIAEDLGHQETRQVVDLIFQRTQELCQQGRTKEILTVDNHADGIYLYLKLKREQPERAEEVLRLLRWNGGNRSGAGIADVDNQGNVHADQFWQHYSFGNIRERSFGDIWDDTSDSLMAGLRNRNQMVTGRCARCQYLDLCGGNFRVRAEAVYGDVWAPDPACYLSDEEIGLVAKTVPS